MFNDPVTEPGSPVLQVVPPALQVIMETFPSLEKGNMESQVPTSPQHNSRPQKSLGEALPSSASTHVYPGEPPAVSDSQKHSRGPQDFVSRVWRASALARGPPAGGLASCCDGDPPGHTHTHTHTHTHLLERPPGEERRPRGHQDVAPWGGFSAPVQPSGDAAPPG